MVSERSHHTVRLLDRQDNSNKNRLDQTSATATGVHTANIAIRSCARAKYYINETIEEKDVINLTFNNQRTYAIVLETDNPDVESALAETFQEIEKEFENVGFSVKAKGKRLVPFEAALDVTVTFASGVTVALIIKLLERLWEEFQKKKVTIQTQHMDVIQSNAEQYLRSIGVTKFKTLERIDAGPYVTFVFKDNAGARHNLIVTSFDIKILQYRREE